MRKIRTFLTRHPAIVISLLVIAIGILFQKTVYDPLHPKSLVNTCMQDSRFCSEAKSLKRTLGTRTFFSMGFSVSSFRVIPVSVSSMDFARYRKSAIPIYTHPILYALKRGIVHSLVYAEGV